MSRKTANTLHMSMADLRRFLVDDNPEFSPPDGDQKQKELNLLMASVFMVKVFDEYRRRSRQEVWDAMEAVRDQLGKFGESSGDYEELKTAGLKVCCAMAKDSEKLCPVPLEVIKVMILALADLGKVRPPKANFAPEVKSEIFKKAKEAGVVGKDVEFSDEIVDGIYLDNFKHEILNARAVLYSSGSQLGKALEGQQKEAEASKDAALPSP